MLGANAYPQQWAVNNLRPCLIKKLPSSVSSGNNVDAHSWSGHFFISRNLFNPSFKLWLSECMDHVPIQPRATRFHADSISGSVTNSWSVFGLFSRSFLIIQQFGFSAEQALGWLMSVPRASGTVLEATVPYSRASMVQLLGKVGFLEIHRTRWRWQLNRVHLQSIMKSCEWDFP